MHGPQILAEFLATPSDPDKYGNVWQYNSRSDRHSKVGCWGVAFDLLCTSGLLQAHARDGKVVLGVNHSMTDFLTGRRKKLDLVIARPSEARTVAAHSLRSLADQYKVHLNDVQARLLAGLPDIEVQGVGAVLVALEAKAAMTAHIKALPRLYDELNSSHLCVHGASDLALAIGYVQVNLASEFASSVTNNYSLASYPLRVTRHNQPQDTKRVLAKVKELPRRSGPGGVGFDGIGVKVLDFENRGGPVALVTGAPAPQPGDTFHYGSMITRMAHEYDARFGSI